MRFEPVPSASELLVLSNVPLEQLEIPKNVIEFIKISDTTQIRALSYCLRNFCPNPTAEFFLNKNSWQNWTEKRKNDPTEWINFLTYLKMYVT